MAGVVMMCMRACVRACVWVRARARVCVWFWPVDLATARTRMAGVAMMCGCACVRVCACVCVLFWPVENGGCGHDVSVILTGWFATAPTRMEGVAMMCVCACMCMCMCFCLVLTCWFRDGADENRGRGHDDAPGRRGVRQQLRRTHRVRRQHALEVHLCTQKVIFYEWDMKTIVCVAVSIFML